MQETKRILDLLWLLLLLWLGLGNDLGLRLLLRWILKDCYILDVLHLLMGVNYVQCNPVFDCFLLRKKILFESHDL